MTPRPDLVKQSDLLNQLVLDRGTMEELGRVDVLWMYPPSHRVLGFISKSGFLGAKKAAFKLSQIEAIGTNGILTHSPPEETNAEKVRQLESVIQAEVWSDAGNKIGKIIDYLFNLKTGDITHYLMVSSGWQGIVGEIYQLPPTQVLSYGKKRVLVAEAGIQSLVLYTEGIKQKIAKAGDILKEDYVQVKQTVTKQAKTVTEQTKGRFQSLTAQARERAEALSKQAKDKVQNLNEQIKEKTETLVQTAREGSHSLAEQLKERTQTLSQQVEDGFETLTVQAEEMFDALDHDLKPPANETPSSTSPQPESVETQQPAPNPNPAPPSTHSDVWNDDDDDDEPWI